jgi:methylamine dehydrogenase accessory protein MauD
MTDALVVSQALLWVLVLVLGGLVLVLARQVGVLHERIAPVGALALSNGPSVGEPAPRVAAQSLSGSLAQIGEAPGDGRSLLLFFLSPRCPVCKTLLPTVQRLARSQRVKLVYASDGAEEDHARFAREHGLDTVDYFVSTELGLRYQIAKLPYAVLIDADGVIRAQGIVNTREHVESLFEAQELGIGTIQEYLDAREDGERDRARAGWEREVQA